MEQVREDFILRLKGRCFFCLIEPLPGPRLGSPESSSVYSLRRLSRFLKMDVGSVLEGKGLVSIHHPLNKESKVNLKVELCEECVSLNGTFSKLHRQLEQIDAEVKSCVNRIRSKLVEAEGTGMMSVNFQNLSTDTGLNAEIGFRNPEIVEALRTEAMQKCASKLGLGSHEDRIPNSPKKAGVSLSLPHPLRGGDHDESPIEVGTLQCTVIPTTGKYRCNVCSKELKSRATFLSHHKSSHSKTKYQCPLCDKEFTRRDIYTKHHRTFHGSIFKCEVCGEVFTRSFRLKQHRKKKHGTYASSTAITDGSDDLEPEIKHEPDTLESLNLGENFDWAYSEMEAEDSKNEATGTPLAEDKTNLNIVECNICHHEVSDLTTHLSIVHVEGDGTVDCSDEEIGRQSTQDSSANSSDQGDQHVNIKSSVSSQPSKGKKSRNDNDEVTRKLEANDDQGHATTTPTPSSSTDTKILPPPLIITPAGSTEDNIKSQATLNPETGRLKCNTCSQEFGHRLSFRYHYETHHLKIRYKCTLCGKQFRRRDNYRIHIQSVHMRVRYKCNICNKRFCQKQLLNKHRRTVHLESIQRVGTQPQSILNPETGARKCPICPKEFKNDRCFRDHYTRNHLTAKYNCPMCEKAYPRKTELMRHQQSIHMGVRFKCHICSKSYCQKQLLTKHHKTVHSGVPQPQVQSEPEPEIPPSTINPETGTHKCPLCPKEYKEERYFQEHYVTVHLKVRHLCPVCGKDYPRKTDVTRHHQTVHMGIRHRCQVCEKSFTLKYNLRQHLRTTTCGGESELQPPSRHVCDICGKDFSMRRGLLQHLESVHKNVRKHMCELCGKIFKTKTHLNTHMQGIHEGGNVNPQ